MIALSLRYEKQDQFWFSFFHEAAHIILHSKKTTFLDAQKIAGNEREQEADRFAANQLIPHRLYDDFIRQGRFYETEVREAAITFGVSHFYVLYFNHITQD